MILFGSSSWRNKLVSMLRSGLVPMLVLNGILGNNIDTNLYLFLWDCFVFPYINGLLFNIIISFFCVTALQCISCLAEIHSWNGISNRQSTFRG